VYDLSTKTLRSLSIAKSFGKINLYSDLANAVNFQHVEEKLSRLENDAAEVIAVIQDVRGQGEFTLTRRSLEALRKFVYLMHYRKPNIQVSYFDESQDEAMKDWIQRYMQKHNITTREALWLHGLSYILDTPHSQIVAKGEETLTHYGWPRFMEMLTTRIDPELENWFACDYEALAGGHYLGIWEAAPGCEFIIGNNSFGLWEGRQGIITGLHRIFIISPKLALILRSNFMRAEVRSNMPFPTTGTLQYIEMPPPIPHYKFLPQPVEFLMKHRTTPAAQKDTFDFKITKLTEAQTREVNEVILLNVPRDGALVFASKEHALRAIRYHIASPDPIVQFERPSEKFRPLLISLLNPHGTGAVEECDADFRLRVIVEVLRRRLDRFPSEWDAAYWCYRAMTADPNQSHPLVLEMHDRLAQVKSLCTMTPGRNFRRNPTARLTDHLNKEDSNCVLGRVSTMVRDMVGYERTKIRTDAAFVRESVIVGFIEWAVKERQDAMELIFGLETYKRLTRI
jgi:hypothetical protein